MVYGIIPARFSSTRFPGKPLALIDGISMIERVYHRALDSKIFTEVIVATDDKRILEHVVSFGGKCVMTSDEHRSGTARCAEASAGLPDNSVIMNIQGDEPFIQTAQLKQLASLFSSPEMNIATLIKKIKLQDELENPNVVKVVTSNSGKAIYFSRLPIPYARDVNKNQWLQHQTYYKHIGLYAYRKHVLQQLACLPATPLSSAENLEQLCWIEHGWEIFTAETDFDSIGIDVPEDIQKALKLIHKNDLHS